MDGRNKSGHDVLVASGTSWDGDRAVGDDKDLEPNALARMPFGDAIHLLLHRAGVGVDVEGDGLGHRLKGRAFPGVVYALSATQKLPHSHPTFAL